MKSVKVRVHGRVQGVYYRATTRAEAQRLGLQGWVRNMSDGTVSLAAQGEAGAVDALIDWCRRGPPGAAVSRLEVEEVLPDEGLSGFWVR